MVQSVQSVRSIYPEPVKSVHTESKYAASAQALQVARHTGEHRPKDESQQAVSKRTDSDKPTVAEEQRMRMIEQAINSIQGPTTRLDFSFHEKTNDVIIRVVNKETGEIIREIPPEKTIDIISKLLEIAGLLVDERV